MVLDWAPTRVAFWDGVERTVPRRLSADFNLWRRTGGGEEANAVYAAYDGGDVLDIGSLYGHYSLILAPKARSGSTFLSFEADLRAVARLQYNMGVASSLFPGVVFAALPWAAGDGGVTRIDFPNGEEHLPRFSSAAGSSDAGGSSLRADDCVRLLGIRPSFVKIDVEGAELSVLRGLEETLAEHRPILMLELHPRWQPPGSSIEQVLQLLNTHGYSSRDISVDDTSVRQLWLPR